MSSSVSEKAIANKIGRIALEAAGISVAMFVIVCGYILWKVEHSSLVLNGLRPTITKSIDKALPEGYHSSVGSITLSSDHRDRGFYEVIVTNVTIMNSQTGAKFYAPELELAFAKNDLMKGKVGLAKVKAIEPSLQIVAISAALVDETHKPVSSDENEDHSNLKSFPNFASFLDNSQFKQIFRKAEIQGLDIEFLEADTGRRWRAQDAAIKMLKEQGSSFLLTGMSVLQVEDEQSDINFKVSYDEVKDIAQIALSGAQMPLGDFATFFTTLPVEAMTSPVSGALDLSVNLHGTILAADFNIDVHQGDLSFGANSMPIHGVNLEGKFNPDANDVTLKKFDFSVGQSKGRIIGAVGLNFSSQNKGRTELNFDLEGQDLLIDTQGLLPDILPLQELAVRGAYYFQKNAIHLENVEFQTDGVGVSGNLSFERPSAIGGNPAPSFGLVADLKTTGKISHNRIMGVWPARLAPRSRAWVQNRIKSGYTENLEFIMDLPVGHKDEAGFIPNESLVLDFDVGNATAEFIPGLTPVTNAYGHGVLRGNSLDVSVKKANLGTSTLSSGTVKFPVFSPVGGGNIITFAGEGQALEMLQILDEEPLGLIGRAGLAPEKISGLAKVDMKIVRPPQAQFLENKKSGTGYEFDGTATFENLTFTEIFQDLDLVDATGTIDLKTRAMTIRGDGQLDASPVNIIWNQRFFPEDGLSDFTLNGVFNAVMADSFGVASRSILRGPVPYTLNATGGYQNLHSFNLNADFKDAAFGFAQLGLRKPAGRPAIATINAQVIDGVTNFSDIEIKGDDIDIVGKMSLEPTGRLRDFSFKKFYFADRADFSAEAHRDQSGALDLSLSGAFLDLGPMIAYSLGAQPIEQSIEQTDTSQVGGFNWGDGVRASMRLDSLGLRNDVVLRDTSLDFWHDSELIQVLDLSGLDEDLDTLNLTMSHIQEVDGNHRAIEAETTDLGSLFEGMFAVTSIQGGTGTLRVDLGSNENPVITGEARATDFRIVEAPLLAKLFAAGSLDGLISLLNDEGITLNRASSEFAVNDGKIQFTDTKAIGPSIGITAEGAVDLSGRGAIDLHGALAPAYQVNSFLGNTPLIGGLFVNREGEGVVALSYDIAGSVAVPSVTINPLTAFVPGVLRRAFESGASPSEEDGSNEDNGQ